MERGGGGPVHVYSVLLIEMFYLLVCLVQNFYSKFSYFPAKTYVVGAQKNHLNVTGKHMLELINKLYFYLFRII